jgi:hypothetical protein
MWVVSKNFLLQSFANFFGRDDPAYFQIAENGMKTMLWLPT